MIPIGKDRVSPTKPFVTWLLLAANLAVFLYQLSLGDAITAFVKDWALVPQRLWDLDIRDPLGYLRYAWLPLLTCMFLHGGWLHLLGNLLTLRVFGDQVEEKLGHLRFLFFYLACGLLASGLHIAFNLHSARPTLGASGAIAGVLGAYLLLFPFEWVRFVVPVLIFPVMLRLPAVVYLLFWLGTQILGGYRTVADGAPAAAGIAFWAHIGGFVAGMFWIRRWRIKRPKRPRKSKR